MSDFPALPKGYRWLVSYTTSLNMPRVKVSIVRWRLFRVAYSESYFDTDDLNRAGFRSRAIEAAHEAYHKFYVDHEADTLYQYASVVQQELNLKEKD